VVACEVGEVPGRRGVGLPDRLGTIDQRDIIEFGAADAPGLDDTQKARLVQLAFCLRRQAAQLLGLRCAIAQARDQSLGAGDHCRISVTGVRFRRRACIRFQTDACHVTALVIAPGQVVETGNFHPHFLAEASARETTKAA
jgi:hypothetical protein